MRYRSVRRARRQRSNTLHGFIVTWDVDSADSRQCTRLRLFIFGRTVTARGRLYRHGGFVEAEGVRYLGQSVLFVSPSRLGLLRAFLRREGISHVVTEATLGRIVS